MYVCVYVCMCMYVCVCVCARERGGTKQASRQSVFSQDCDNERQAKNVKGPGPFFK